MEVSKTSFTQLSKMVSHFAGDEASELEIKYVGSVNRVQFSRLISMLKQQRGVKEVHLPESLDIFFAQDGKHFRMTVEGMDHIQELCKNNRVRHEMVKSLITKQSVPSFKPLFFDDFSFKVDLKNEIDIPLSDDLLEIVSNVVKGFRYKKRYSFVSGSVRFDLTVVKSSSPSSPFLSHKRFATSGTLTSPEKYEVEIELVNRRGAPVDLAKTLLTAGVQAHVAIIGSEAVTTRHEQEAAFASYNTVWRSIEDANKKGRVSCLGPQPVTLELQNVAVDGVDEQTILKDYTVTEKADGERCMLFVANDGKCWFISSTMQFTYTGVTLKDHTLKQTIVDGELVTRDAHGQPTTAKIYAMFDAYVVSGKDIRSQPLTGKVSRISHLQAFEKKAKGSFANQVNITMFTKSFLEGNIFDQSKRLLDMSHADQFPYRIDGLIYTPAKLPVGGLFEGDTPSHGTWLKVFKWKPPQENSIDFCVKRTNDERVAVDGEVFKAFHLYVGYRPASWEPIKPKQVLTGKWEKPSEVYGLKLFTPAETVTSAVSMFYGQIQVGDVVKCKNGDVIENDCIVEFSYVNDESLSYPHRWVPLRVRKDKKSPNDFSTAMNVWRSIGYPVTEAIITGTHDVHTTDIPTVEAYYKRITSRDKFISRNMMYFHNQGVKNSLISQYVRTAGATTLLDIACGKAGDLNKWISSGLTTVFGVDKSRDNIQNPVDGAYTRLMSTREANDRKYVFGTMDATRRITPDYVASLDEDDQYVGDLLFKHGKFDIVSCQFALHYFYEKDAILENFASNVASFLRPGGYFIGTCLDGEKVQDKLRGKDIVKGVHNNRLVWQIKRVSDREVKVYMESIGAEISEYVVDFAELTEKFKAYGMVPVEFKSFEDIYNQTLQSNQTAYFIDFMKAMTEVEKEYSFMNTTFVYRMKETTTVEESSVAPPKKKVAKKKPVPVIVEAEEVTPAPKPKKKTAPVVPNVKTITVVEPPPPEINVAPPPEVTVPPKKKIVKKKQV